MLFIGVVASLLAHRLGAAAESRSAAPVPV
jgi:hypothetical protein